VFFAVCALVIAEEAATNDRGLILEGIFRFSPHGATVFYWVLAGLSALFVLAALFLAVGAAQHRPVSATRVRCGDLATRLSSDKT